MTRGILDTSVFIARETGRHLDPTALPDEVAVSIITIAELRAGVLSATSLDVRDRRLATLTAALALDPLPVDDDVARQWARLRVALRDAGSRMGINDAWIAATAMSEAVPVVTQDDDFPVVDGLEVVLI